MTRTASVLLLLAACAQREVEREEPPDAAAAEAAAEALLEAVPVPPAEPPSEAKPTDGPAVGVQTSGAEVQEPARLELQWTGIGPLHKGFFSDRAAVTRLSAGLAGEVRSPVPIAIRYDSTTFAGQLRLVLDPGALVRTVDHSRDRVRLQDLTVITQALAQYRSEVAGRFDFRLESFEVGIEAVRAGRSCVFRLAGPPPPDGRLVSPCVEINGSLHCGTPTAEGVRFSEAAAADVAACLDLSH